MRAAETDKRLILIFLRGALDGLNVVVPYGDRNLKKWRESLVLPEPGQPGGLSDLGGFWGLHPSLKAMHAIYRANDLLPLQAVAGPNRSRSHFEAQDMMEIGAEKRMTSGWLNRLTALLPRASIGDTAVSMGTMTPLILHGPTPVTTWNPFHARPAVSPGFYENIVAMHAPDAQTGSLLGDALAERRHLDKLLAGVSYDGISGEFPRLARAAARMLASADGPRLAELDLDGWDTHTNQHVRLTQALRQLDDGIAIL
ncbi:MAG: DUF1501 domain-containing protein, partial [Rhodospirillales bacterium]|nr:DUF1501 domain-containing protein [Acetobacter sp.]